jgi:isopenicillin N synthase-like dioxygenase
MSAAAQTEAVAASEHGRIPVLDIGPYLAGETGAAARLGRAIAPTFEDTGFLVIADHGVSPRLVEDTFAVATQFFARPAADKLALKCRTELHDPTDPLSAAPQLGGERVRLRPAHRQQFPDLPRAVGAAGSRGAHREGEWIRPPALPGTFVVNTGAMLARYSNDRFRATPHRVINQNEGSRYAIPFFLGPNHDSVVECVPTCVGPTTRRATNRRPTAPSVSGC